MLVDEVTLTLKAGDGGAGRVSFFPMRKGPDGGDGGKGGDIYVVASSQITDLHTYKGKRLLEAQKGKMGGSFNKNGVAGETLELRFPIGTEFHDLETGHVLELDTEGQCVLMCQGGQGGYGNDHYKSSTNQIPQRADPGDLGEERQFKIIMKLIAHYGLIGLPNAGKSSLLNELTAAHVKTANYPFTTLTPNLGAIDKKIIADIPGLIEGASEGRGLGIKFLKHIEKVELLLHCVGLDSKDVEKDYTTVRKELAQYNEALVNKPEVILLTKSDLSTPEEIKKQKQKLLKYNDKILVLSIHDYDALEELKKMLV